MNWYLEVLKKYATFDGRARRAEYWYFMLFSTIVSYGLAFVEYFISKDMTVQVIPLMYSLLVLLPSLAVGVRRLHDTDRSGWWLLIALIPLIGIIVLFVFMVFKGTDGENRFGQDPLSSENQDSQEDNQIDEPQENEVYEEVIQTTQENKPVEELPKTKICRLHFLTGEFEGNSIDATKGESIILGRDPNQANIIISNERISSAHMKVSFDGDEVIVEDLNSTNGSFYVNGTQSVKVDRGSTISLTQESSGVELILVEKEICSFRVEFFEN